ncbi:MAG: hypothetical protein JST84_21635 [Acidobacteria bacterium]|nr:hypothetical protein [Acidobacteriota bacterium]
MSLKTVRWEIQAKNENPSFRFLLMFIGVVPGSLLLFAIGVRDFSVLPQPSLAWSFLIITLFVSLSIIIGGWKFWHQVVFPNPLSIFSTLPVIPPRKN